VTIRFASLTLAVAFAVASLPASAASPDASVDTRGRSADMTVGHVAAAGTPASPLSHSIDDTGDADSFGRAVNWLGLTDGEVDLLSDCSGDTFACQPLAAAPASTSFSFADLGHITLPARAAHSLVCYWFSPFLTVQYGNDSAAAVVANLNFTPTITVENALLDDPTLIDPNTGVAFNGSLLTALTSSTIKQVPLPAGLHLSERSRDSAVCIAGLLSRETLVDDYGLSEQQAKEFFKHDMTLRLNVSGSAQYVDSATLYFGLRLVGD
jgi:hypothetical protein